MIRFIMFWVLLAVAVVCFFIIPTTEGRIFSVVFNVVFNWDLISVIFRKDYVRE